MTKKRLRELERIHILRTIVRLDDGKGVHGISIADGANDECDHSLLETVPRLSRRAMGQKLNAMSLDGLVQAHWQSADRLYLWTVTRKGRAMAASIGEEGAPHGD